MHQEPSFFLSLVIFSHVPTARTRMYLASSPVVSARRVRCNVSCPFFVSRACLTLMPGAPAFVPSLFSTTACHFARVTFSFYPPSITISA